MSFNDATCENCGRRVSWFGEAKDRPACKCGCRPDQSELDVTEALLEEMRREMLGNDYDEGEDHDDL